MRRDFRTQLIYAVVAAGLTVAAPAYAQQYPTKPVRLLVPFAPGGGTDITARAIAQGLSERLGQQFVADNRPGANGTIAVDILTKSLPDGYTLSMISSSHSVNASLIKGIAYDLTKDVLPITQATTQPYALVVHPSVQAKSVKELIALAKAKPGQLNYGSSGNGGLSHLSGALFSYLAQIDIVHVPYKGGNPAMIDVIAGQIQMLYSTILQSQPHIKAGKLRPLAVTTAKRSRAAPDLPTMQEAGVKGYEVAGWYGMIAPLKTPPAIIDRLNKQVVQVLHSPEVAPRLAADGSEPVGSTPQQFGQHIKSEVAKWAKLTKQMNIRMD
ncbi:MAG TPA: tripartite tricarboxylate transporter substrate binding protein [Burkholderiales bacterium]|nr:tripartite tricarboxylate transporter substrate binding protein [Burkholderiales bacterium]